MLSLTLTGGPAGPAWRLEADLREEAEHFLAVVEQRGAGGVHQTAEGRWVAWLRDNYFDHDRAGVFPWTRLEFDGADPESLARAAAAWAAALRGRAGAACPQPGPDA